MSTVDDTGRAVADWIKAHVVVDLDRWQRALVDRMFTPDRPPDVVGVDPARDGDATVVGAWIDDGRTYVAPIDPESIRDSFAADVRAIAAVTEVRSPFANVPRRRTGPTTAGRWLMRGLSDDITGRTYPDDGLHPPSLLAWYVVVEGRDADGNPLQVCDHCGEPTPCTERVLRHMDTDGHHTFCIPTGTCYEAGRPVKELPTR